MSEGFMIHELQRKAHETAQKLGWYDQPRSVGELLVLCHSELSEALEVYRVYGPTQLHRLDYEPQGPDESPKPVGFGIEIADLIIRVVDMCEDLGIDLTECLRIKMEYNQTRPYRHGGKYL